jgi:hypothetical protein
MQWKKSSRSSESFNCVEVAVLGPSRVAVRDSKDPAGPVLSFGVESWESFIQDVRVGAFDRPSV